MDQEDKLLKICEDAIRIIERQDFVIKKLNETIEKLISTLDFQKTIVEYLIEQNKLKHKQMKKGGN